MLHILKHQSRSLSGFNENAFSRLTIFIYAGQLTDRKKISCAVRIMYEKDGSVFTLIHRNFQADVNGNRRNLLFYSWFNQLNKEGMYLLCTYFFVTAAQIK